MFFLNNKIRSNVGDTIIEVLIAVAVLGVIIGAGYSIATRSLNGVQASNERSEATKLAEGQLEAFKAYVDRQGGISNLYNFSTPNDGTDVSNNIPVVLNSQILGSSNLLTFCFDPDGNVIRFNMGQDLGTDSLDNIQSGKYPTNSLDFPNSTGCVYNDGRYYVAFNADKNTVDNTDTNDANSKVDQYIFTVQVTWQKIGGGSSPEKVKLHEKATY